MVKLVVPLSSSLTTANDSNADRIGNLPKAMKLCDKMTGNRSILFGAILSHKNHGEGHTAAQLCAQLTFNYITGTV